MKPRKTKDATRLLDALIGDDQELRDRVAEEHLNARVARMIYDARAEAGLTQKQLASLVGTTQSVIARLEDADYEGHSLSMLQRIAGALGKRIEISLTTKHRRKASLAKQSTRRPLAIASPSPARRRRPGRRSASTARGKNRAAP